MALFVITALDKPGALDLRNAERPAHRAYLAEQAAMIKVAGPLLDEAGDMNGSVFIIEAADIAAARAFSAGDPFSRCGLFEQVEIRPWMLTVGGFA
jgi:uncharacterized protein YciI